jgi:hypothetical protein
MWAPRRGAFLLICACAALAQVVWAQAQTVATDVEHGQATHQTEVKRGEVVYVSGNDLVVKLDTGQVKHVTVPDDFKFIVDGKELTVHDLTPGMKLTQTITTTTTPRTVTTVRTLSGKVWNVNPPYVILTLADGTNKQYKVPEGTTFNIGGEKKTVFDLRKGMNVSATVVTETPETVVASNRMITGQAPPTPPAPPSAPVVYEEPVRTAQAAPPAAPEPAAQPAEPAPEPAPKKLPSTGSYVPLIGLSGAFMLAAGAGLRLLRRLSS